MSHLNIGFYYYILYALLLRLHCFYFTVLLLPFFISTKRFHSQNMFRVFLGHFYSKENLLLRIFLHNIQCKAKFELKLAIDGLNIGRFLRSLFVNMF